jgi:hypothetical protein
MSSFDSIMMRARESTPQSDVATQCFRDGFAPLPTACVNQDAVPVGYQHPCRRASNAVGRSGDANDSHGRHPAQAGGPARTGGRTMQT